MDFKGQLHCERAFQIMVILFGLVGFVFGYLEQDFRLTFQFLAAGGGISAVVRLRSRARRAADGLRAHATPRRPRPRASSATRLHTALTPVP